MLPSMRALYADFYASIFKCPFTLNVNVNVCVKFYHCVYGDVDVDTENWHITHSLRFVLFFSKKQTHTLTLSVNGP